MRLLFHFWLPVILLINSLTGLAQNRIRSTTLYLEGGGAAGFYSVNLDQIVFERGFLKGATRVGYSYTDGSLIPFGISTLIGKGGNYFEVGIGYAPYFPRDKSESTSDLFSLRAGYRYQNPDGGFFMNFAPLYLNGGTLGNSPPLKNRIWFGLGLGYTLH